MKKLLFVFCFIFFAANILVAGERELKLMTFNLRFGEIATMQEFVDVINSESPDIVAIQECDWATYRERAPKQNGIKFINELASGTGMFGQYGKAIDYKKGYYGVGILSKYPIVRSERIFLPCFPGTEQRIMLEVDIELPDGEIVTFVCTHLEVSSSENRMEQVKFIQKQLKGKKRVLLCGDMNAVPESPEMLYLSKYWIDLTSGLLTHSTKKLNRHIDYIYTKPECDAVLLSCRILSEVKLSDHYPVVSEIILKD